MANRSAVAIFLWLSMVACGSDISKPEGAGIRIISDITRTDTIEAQSSFPLVLAISDGTGGLAHPVEVDISGAPASLGHGMIPFDPVSSLSGTFSMSSTGQVSILVQFGSREGQEAITITVPELQLSSTLWFTVKPGRPAYLTLRPGDTAIVLNATYKQTGVVVDRAGNDLNVAAQLVVHSSDPSVAVSASGQVSGTAYGRAPISVEYGPVKETAMVSVVPMAKLAGVAYSGDLSVVTTDGSTVRRFATGSLYYYGMSWSADGAYVLHTANANYPGSAPTPRIYALTPATGVSRAIISDTLTALRGIPLVSPSQSRDGSWVYFVALFPTGGAIWRTHLDGTGAEEIVGPPQTLPYVPRAAPSSSFDGSRLAYISSGDVRIVNALDGSTISISGLGAKMIRWSPIASQLAIRGDTKGLYIVNADGTGLRQLATDLAPSETLDWSPDAKWLIASLPNPTLLTRAAMINVETGLQLPLQLSVGETVAWSPK